MKGARVSIALARADVKDLEHQVIVLRLHLALPKDILFECLRPQMREFVRLGLRRVNSSLDLEQTVQVVLVFIVIAVG